LPELPAWKIVHVQIEAAFVRYIIDCVNTRVNVRKMNNQEKVIVQKLETH